MDAGRIDRKIDRWIDGKMERRIDEKMQKRMNNCVERWMNRWMDVHIGMRGCEWMAVKKSTPKIFVALKFGVPMP